MADDSKILKFYLEAAKDPSLIEKYRECGLDYLRDEWDFSVEDVEYMKTCWVMTVWPMPPIIWCRPLKP
jgi:hypothetical protein